MISGMNENKIGAEWVGRVIDAQFALQQWLGGAGAGGVFRTQLGEPAQNAAVKVIPADRVDAESLIAQWTAAQRLSHPNLMRVIHAGRGEIDGSDVVYAVTEYSEEILSGILAERPLTTDEVRETLGPMVAALSWLHAQGLAHGGLKPSNIMAVNDQLKLSVDRVQRAGRRVLPAGIDDIHDAPESAETITPAADVWSLGVLLVEAFAQQPPPWDGTGEPAIPASVPEPFAIIARECLCLDPARRCTVIEVKPLLAPSAVAVAAPAAPAASLPNPAPAAPPASTAPESIPPAASTEPAATIPAAPSVRIRPKAPANRRAPIIILVALLLIGAVVGVIVATRRSGASISDTPRPSAGTVSPAPASGAINGATVPGAVLHRALPDVPRSAADTIRGHVRVGVRVQVDRRGNVAHADLESPGPSRYFANLALNAARNWKFRPAQAHGRAVPSVWLLHFAFAPTGPEVTPVETDP